MINKATFINKTTMRKVNSALEADGFSGYPGDHTTSHPNGSGSGYLSNLIAYIAGQDHDVADKVMKIVDKVVL